MIPESDIVAGLKKLTEYGIKLRDVEKKVGMPLNSLSRNLKSGKIPLKYKEALFAYLKKKEIEVLLGNNPATDVIKKSLEALDEYISKTSKEEKQRILKEVKDMKIGGPTLKEFFRDLFGSGVLITHTDKKGELRVVNPLSEEGQAVIDKVEIQKEIEKLEGELEYPPQHIAIGKNLWISIRKDRIEQLKKQLI